MHAEVLDRQPPEVRDLLLRSGVLDSVNGPLADALTGRLGIASDPSGARRCQCVSSTAVDVGVSWFRYHPMLRDLLSLELRQVDPALSRTLHRTAARWFGLPGASRGGHPPRAIRRRLGPGCASAGRAASSGLTLDCRGAEVRALVAAFRPGAPAEDAGGSTRRRQDLRRRRAVRGGRRLHPQAPSAWLRRWTPIGSHSSSLRLAARTLRLACARGDVDAVPPAAGSVETALEAQSPSDVRRTQTHWASALVDLGIAGAVVPEVGRSAKPPRGGGRGCAPDRAAPPRDQVNVVSRACGHAHRSPGVRRSPAGRAGGVAGGRLRMADGGRRRRGVCHRREHGWLGRFADAEQWLERADRALAEGGAPGVEVLVRHTSALLRLAQGRIEDALRQSETRSG